MIQGNIVGGGGSSGETVVFSLQNKTVAPTDTAQVITPDDGYSGLASVTVGPGVTGPGELQEKTVKPGEAAQVVTPDEGYDGLAAVTVEAAPLQEKAVTPFTSPQDITPDPGYYGLSKVTVGAYPTGDGAVFATRAVGVLPVVTRGTASSEFSLTFETSATGAVV